MGAFRGVPPSRKQVTQTGNVIYQVRNGKFIRAWTQIDRLGMLQQIGAIPASFVGRNPAGHVKEK
jgi:predicted ester cyclase